MHELQVRRDARENKYELRLTQVTQFSLCDALGSYYGYCKFVRKLLLHLQRNIQCIYFSILISREHLYITAISDNESQKGICPKCGKPNLNQVSQILLKGFLSHGLKITFSVY